MDQGNEAPQNGGGGVLSRKKEGVRTTERLQGPGMIRLA